MSRKYNEQVQPTDRQYDPNCDNEDVTFRAACLMVENGMWTQLEEIGVIRTLVEQKMEDITDTYGRVLHSRSWKNDATLELIRRELPELVAASRTLQSLYRIVTSPFAGVAA